MVCAPFRERVLFLFGRSKRFRAEDHLPVPLASAIQTFLCGGSKLPFGSGVFQSRHSFRLPLSLGLALVAMFTGAVGSPLDCKFRGMCLCAWPGLSWCLPFASLVRDMWRLRCSSFHFLVGFSSLSYVCCDVVAIRCCLLCFVGAGPVWKDACMDWARIYLRNAPVHALGPGLDQAEA